MPHITVYKIYFAEKKEISHQNKTSPVFFSYKSMVLFTQNN